jgi:Uma2 family endonuclease
MDQLLERILRSPKLELYAEQIEETRRLEHIARDRFIDELREDEKAEFINGEKIVHSPAKVSHNRCRARLADLLRVYVKVNHLGEVGDENWLISLSRNDYEPDISFWSSGKSAQFSSDQMRLPAPDLIVEVLSTSTESVDRGIKFEDYAAHGVQEYWLIDPDEQTIEQFALAGEQYRLGGKSSAGLIRSTAIRGFQIPVAAIFDDAQNLAELRRLLD